MVGNVVGLETVGSYVYPSNVGSLVGNTDGNVDGWFEGDSDGHVDGIMLGHALGLETVGFVEGKLDG